LSLPKKNEEKDFAGMGMEQFFNRKKTLASVLNRMSLLLLREKKGDRIKKKNRARKIQKVRFTSAFVLTHTVPVCKRLEWAVHIQSLATNVYHMPSLVP